MEIVYKFTLARRAQAHDRLHCTFHSPFFHCLFIRFIQFYDVKKAATKKKT